MTSNEEQEPPDEDSIYPDYLQSWEVILTNLLGWSREQVQEYCEDFADCGRELTREYEARWVASLLYPKEWRSKYAWWQLARLKSDIVWAIHGKDEHLDILDKGYDWHVASQRIKVALREFEERTIPKPD